MSGGNFFSEIGKSIAKATRKAADSTGSAVNTARMKAQISGENKEIEKLYQRLGESVFRRAGEDPAGFSDEDLAVFEEIRAHLGAVAALEGQLAAAKGMKICPSCRELVETGAAFCPMCGAAFPQETITHEPEEAPAAESGTFGEESADDIPQEGGPEAAEEPENRIFRSGAAAESADPEAEDDILDAEFQQVEDEEAIPADDSALNAEYEEISPEAAPEEAAEPQAAEAEPEAEEPAEAPQAIETEPAAEEPAETPAAPDAGEQITIE